MSTFNQLIRHGREEKRRTDRTKVSVFGLMVTRTQNFLYSVLFLIPVFRDINQVFSCFSWLPIIKKMPRKYQLLLLLLCKLIFALVLTKFFLYVGYVFFDDLTRALSQFYPVGSGGLGGGGNTPMPPTNPSEGFLGGYLDNHDEPSTTTRTHTDSQHLFLNLEVEDQNKDPIEEQVEAESFKCDKIKGKIVQKTYLLLLKKGYRISDITDIQRIVDVAMFNHESIDIDRRKKRFYYLSSCLGKNHTPFWKEILELLPQYNITLTDTDTNCDD